MSAIAALRHTRRRRESRCGGLTTPTPRGHGALRAALNLIKLDVNDFLSLVMIYVMERQFGWQGTNPCGRRPRARPGGQTPGRDGAAAWRNEEARQSVFSRSTLLSVFPGFDSCRRETGLIRSRGPVWWVPPPRCRGLRRASEGQEWALTGGPVARRWRKLIRVSDRGTWRTSGIDRGSRASRRMARCTAPLHRATAQHCNTSAGRTVVDLCGHARLSSGGCCTVAGVSGG